VASYKVHKVCWLYCPKNVQNCIRLYKVLVLKKDPGTAMLAGAALCVVIVVCQKYCVMQHSWLQDAGNSKVQPIWNASVSSLPPPYYTPHFC